jgi:hypothetical protein
MIFSFKKWTIGSIFRKAEGFSAKVVVAIGRGPRTSGGPCPVGVVHHGPMVPMAGTGVSHPILINKTKYSYMCAQDVQTHI